MISLLENHLWQSTLFAAIAGLLTLALRQNQARARYWIWLAASAKFLLPFALLVSAGNRVPLPHSSAVAPRLPVAATEIGQIAQPFTPSPIRYDAVPAATAMPVVFAILWIFGTIAVLLFWFARWRRVRAIVRAASPIDIGAQIETLSSTAPIEPGVFGIFRPVLLLPDGIAERLTPAQLRAIVAHETCHARRRDNLTSAIHMLVEAVFWFHPLVWWIGARLVDERERACDEEVLRQGSEPETYAEGILGVCRLYLESPLVCVSGVTGADLKKRIEGIMTNRIIRRMGFGRKLILAGASAMAVILPVSVGILSVPHGQAQSPAAPTFDVATVKPSPPPQGDLIQINLGTMLNGTISFNNVSLSDCLKYAYGIVSDAQLVGPDWIKSKEVRFDIVAKAPPNTSRDRIDLMLQNLLAERLKVAVHHEQREIPHLALVVGKNGPKLRAATTLGPNPARRGHIAGSHMPMRGLAMLLSRFERQTIIDETGLKGDFEVKLDWTPDDAIHPDDQGAPSLFTAVEEQLGLKLESRKGPLDVLVVDHAEKIPTDN